MKEPNDRSSEFPFEKLDVWHLAIGYADRIYSCTEELPNTEKFGLVTQLQRSANSVAANIAEGAGRETPRATLKYVQDAYGSLMETVSHLELCRHRDFVRQEVFAQLDKDASEIARMLSGLRRSVQRRLDS